MTNDPTFEAYANFRAILVGGPNIIRQVNLTYTEHGEVVSDGAENWKCYGGYQREDKAPTSDYISSYLFGFALRKDE